jgi:transposase
LEDEFEEEANSELKRVPKEARTLVAEVCDAYVAQGGSVEQFRSLFSNANYSLPARTLQRWRANVNSVGEALPGGEGRGRPRALSPEEERLFLVGFFGTT